MLGESTRRKNKNLSVQYKGKRNEKAQRSSEPQKAHPTGKFIIIIITRPRAHITKYNHQQDNLPIRQCMTSTVCVCVCVCVCFILFIYLFSFTACVQVKSKLHAEGMPATGADIQSEKKNINK